MTINGIARIYYGREPTNARKTKDAGINHFLSVKDSAIDVNVKKLAMAN